MTRSNRTLARLERILVMVPWLLEHPGVDVDEVTARFGVSRDELAEDLDVLGYCGLPGYGGGDLVETSLFGDRVTVRMADFFRRPLRLSVREAVTLVLAARAFGAVQGMPESAALRRAEEKLSVALGAAAPAAAADARVAVDLHSPGDEHLPVLRAAVEEGRVVHLVYRSGSGETTERDVEPWAVVGVGGAWYLQGHCRLAGGPRDFRLDRIRELQVRDERITTTLPAAGRSPAYEPSPDDQQVVLELGPTAWWLGEWVVADEVRDDGPRRRVTLRTSHLDWVARLVLRAAPEVTVVAPDELRARVRDLAAAALRRYEGGTGNR